MKTLLALLFSTSFVFGAVESVTVDSNTRDVRNPGIINYATNLLRVNGVPVVGGAGGGGSSAVTSVNGEVGDVHIYVSPTVLVRHAGGTVTAMQQSANNNGARGAVLISAVGAAVANDTIDVGPGTFDIAQAILLPSKVNITGAGRETTIITNSVTGTFAGPRAILKPGDGSTVENLTVQATGPAGMWQAPIGMESQDPIAHNVVIRNVHLIGDSDCLWVLVWDGAQTEYPNPPTIKVYDSIFESKYDAINIIAPGAVVDVYNTSISTIGPSLTNLWPGETRGIVSYRGGGSLPNSLLRFFGGTIKSAGGTTLTCGAFTLSGGKMEIYNTRMEVSSATGTVTDLVRNGGPLNYSDVVRADGLPLVTSGTVTNISRNASLDMANTFLQSNIFTFGAGLSAGSSGRLVDIKNPSVATAIGQMWSPELAWSGAGWKTDSPAASQNVAFRSKVIPTIGTAHPGSYLLIEGLSNNSHTNVPDSTFAMFTSGTFSVGTDPAIDLGVPGIATPLVRAAYKSLDGTVGASTTTGGATFKNGLYTSGTITGGGGSGTIATTSNILKGDNAGNAVATTPGTDYDVAIGTQHVGDVPQITAVSPTVITWTKEKDTWAISASDLTTALSTGTSKGYIRAPFAATVTGVKASLLTAGSGLTTFDINESGTTILSTKLSVDASEKTSTTAATAAVISDTLIANDAEITVDIDGAGVDAAGAVIYIYVTR